MWERFTEPSRLQETSRWAWRPEAICLPLHSPQVLSGTFWRSVWHVRRFCNIEIYYRSVIEDCVLRRPAESSEIVLEQRLRLAEVVNYRMYQHEFFRSRWVLTPQDGSFCIIDLPRPAPSLVHLE